MPCTLSLYPTFAPKLAVFLLIPFPCQVSCQASELSDEQLKDPELVAGRRLLSLQSVSDVNFFVYTRGVFDYEATPRVALLLVCLDAAEMSPGVVAGATRVPPKEHQLRITLAVGDMNDNPPVFDQPEGYSVTLAENSRPGTLVVEVHASDRDSHRFGQITYELGVIRSTGRAQQSSRLEAVPPSRLQAAFVVDSTTGRIEVGQSTLLDRESTDRLIVPVLARDGGGLVTSVEVEVHLTDVNDCPPRLDPATATPNSESGGGGAFEVHENARVGSLIGRIRVVDPDLLANARIHLRPSPLMSPEVSKYIRLTRDHDPRRPDTAWRQTERLPSNSVGGEAGDDPSSLELVGDGVVSALLVTQMPVDREAYANLFYELIASDSGQPSLSATMTLSIRVLDVNDHQPEPVFPPPNITLGYNPPVYTNSPLGSLVCQVRADDPDQGENGTILFSLMPGTNGSHLFRINQTSGGMYTAWMSNVELRTGVGWPATEAA
ncbi:unnamed protein product, partial [Protopolystoma xenopodis]